MTAPRPGRSGGGPAGSRGDPAASSGDSAGSPGDPAESSADPAGRSGGVQRGTGGSGCVAGLFVLPSDARPGDRRRPWDTRPHGRLRGRRDRGSVTAELAAAMPVLVVLLLAGVMAVAAAGTKIRCVSAARDAALAAARGENGAAAAGRMAPDGSTVQVSTDGDLARATVSAQVRPFGNLLPGFTVSSSAVAAVEPGGPP